MESDLTTYTVYDNDGSLVAGPFISFDEAMAAALKRSPEWAWEIVETEYKNISEHQVEHSENFSFDY